MVEMSIGLDLDWTGSGPVVKTE